MPHRATRPPRSIAGRTSILLAGPCTWLLLAGCEAAGPAEDGAVAVRDSLGIEIVENRAPVWEGDDGWTIDPDPVLQIGEVEGDPAYEFAAIEDAARMPDGRIVVVDRRSREVRVFGSGGDHLVTFGRPGQGPGEFGTTPSIALLPPDTILVWDSGNRRLSRYSAGGELLEERSLLGRLEEASIIGTAGWTVGPGGALVAHEFRMGSGEGGRRIHHVEFVLVRDLAQETIPLGSFPARPEIRVQGEWIGSPFSPAARVAVGPGPLPVALARGEAWEVELLDGSGAVRRAARAPVPRLPISPDLMREQRERWAERTNLSSRQVEEAWGALGPTDSIPAIGHLSWDREGNLWVGRGDESIGRVGRFDVLTSEGRWLGTVPIPEELGTLSSSEVLEIGHDYLLAVRLDDLGVQYVRQYRIRKPG